MLHQNSRRGIGPALSLACAATAQEDGELSVTVFSDAYVASDRHDPMINGLNGLWFRRIYLSLSPNVSPTLYIFGVDMKLSENVHLIPNVEWVSYSNPTVVSTPGDDLFIRLSIVAKF